MTAIIEIRARFETKLKEIIADMAAVVSVTAYSSDREASQLKTVAKSLVDIEDEFNVFMRRLVEDLNADFDVLSDFEKADLVDASFATIANSWDYQFTRRAEELRDGATYSAADRTAEDRRAA